MSEIENLSIFDYLYCEKKITKPIRLIELFGGVGSQAMALRNIKAHFEHYRLVEYDKYPVASYNAIHGTNFEPTDITKIHANDLGIIDTDKYEYIMTYSFPCQDLSLAGKQRGMTKGSGTRSGLLWEVERLLDEAIELPQILLMENVPEVIGEKNIKDFQDWELKLRKLGYTNYTQILNAKDFGIPQNRRRCFMVSILGDYNYRFPKTIPLKLRLKDMLEDEVDENYYLTEKQIQDISNWNGYQKPLENIKDGNDISPTLTTRTSAYSSSMILINEATKKGYAEAREGDGVYINRPHQKRGVVQKDKIQTLKTSCADIGVVVKDNMKNKLCNNLIKNGLVKEMDVIKHSYTGQIMEGNKKCVEAHNEMVTLTTRGDCYGVAVKDTENNNLRIRKLTPLECWRLMGFTDEDYKKASKVNRNSMLYKQAGNSIVVNVLEAIFKQLL